TMATGESGKRRRREPRAAAAAPLSDVRFWRGIGRSGRFARTGVAGRSRDAGPDGRLLARLLSAISIAIRLSPWLLSP
ncbi:MAG TPA: hypothetical protein VGW38_07530, partial [Chloroflexota bacterium]|nr:hypothetical protein [Chloroflexota bacterium]